MTDEPHPVFTIFTPTYNRAHVLHRVYESLLAQTYRNFEWLIIDDGSTDETTSLVDGWIHSSNTWFPIRYFWQENQHKKAAHNRGVQEARGQLFLTFDSDDRCTPDALERMLFHWEQIPTERRENFSAVTGLCSDESGVIIGDHYPCENWIDSNTLEISYRYRVRGEKWGFQRTDVLREYLFPQEAIKLNGLVTEGLIWNRIAEKYQTRFVNEIWRTYYTNGMASGVVQVTSRSQLKRNATGGLFGYQTFLSQYFSYIKYDPITFIKVGSQVTRFYLHCPASDRSQYLPKGCLQKLWVLGLAPLGILLYIRDVLRG